MITEVDHNDMRNALIRQREVQATEAATVAAAYEGVKRALAVAEARIVDLEAELAKASP